MRPCIPERKNPRRGSAGGAGLDVVQPSYQLCNVFAGCQHDSPRVRLRTKMDPESEGLGYGQNLRAQDGTQCLGMKLGRGAQAVVAPDPQQPSAQDELHEGVGVPLERGR